MSIDLAIAALFAHFVADFPVQAIGHRRMGQKATRLDHLAWHAASYAFAFAAVFWLFSPFALASKAAAWVGLNAAMHGVIDFWTSKATKHYWTRHVRLPIFLTAENQDGSPAPIDQVRTPPGYALAHVWTKDNRYAGPFFTVIGFDQFLHVAFLLWSGHAMGVL
jgi:hypothetical protein